MSYGDDYARGHTAATQAMEAALTGARREAEKYRVEAHLLTKERDEAHARMATAETALTAVRAEVRHTDSFLYEMAARFDDMIEGLTDFETFYESCADRCIPTADALTRALAAAVPGEPEPATCGLPSSRPDLWLPCDRPAAHATPCLHSPNPTYKGPAQPHQVKRCRSCESPEFDCKCLGYDEAVSHLRPRCCANCDHSDAGVPVQAATEDQR